MKNVRRIKRMARGRKKKRVSMNLVSLMDVFTILVFFLLVNSANTEEISNPKNLKLPDSVAERKPEQTVVVMVTSEAVMLHGELITTVDEVMAVEGSTVPSIRAALEAEARKAIGLSEQSKDKRREVTIMGDRGLPFKLLKKVMTSCTAAGFQKISLAVIQKASQTG